MSPFRIVIVFIVCSILGIAALTQQSVDLLPSHKATQLTISYGLPDAAPDYIETEVTAPLENVLSQISGIKSISSTSSYNSGTIELTFEPDENMAYKKFETAAIIRRVYPKLNKNLSYPYIDQRSKDKDETSPLLIYNINGNYTATALRKMCNDYIQKPLSNLSGIKKIIISGAEQLQVKITYDPDKMNAYQVARDQITTSLQQRYEVAYNGKYSNDAGQEMYIKIGKSALTVAELGNTVIIKDSTLTIRLKDLATINIEEQSPNSYLRIDGKSSVTLSIYSREAQNKIALVQSIQSQLKSIGNQLPKSLAIHESYNDTEYLTEELDKIYTRSILSISILLIFIFLVNRNISYLTILFVGILVNVSIVSLLAWFFGITVHLYTIAGITISMGLIVDNAIVMIDHLYKNKSKKISTALLAASLTTISALMMVFFLPEEDQENLLDFSKIVSLSLAVSFILALLFTPALKTLIDSKVIAAKMPLSKLRRQIKVFKVYYATIQIIARFKKSFLTLIILAFGLPIFMLPSSWENHEWYNTIVGNDFYQEEVRPVSDKLLGGSLRMFVRNVFEKSSYRKPQKTKLYVNAELPFGHTIEQMNDVLKGVETYLSQVDGIDKFISRVYSGQYGSIEISFESAYENGALPYRLKNQLISRSLDWGGVTWNVYGVGKSFSNSSGESIPSFRVKMMGYNYDKLEEQADILANKLLKHKRIQEVKTNARISWQDKSTKQFHIAFDQNKMSLAGVGYNDVVNGLTLYSKPTNPTTRLLIDDHLYPVLLRSKNAESFSKHGMMHTNIASNQRVFKVSDFAEVVLETTASGIHKKDRQYIRIVAFEYFGNYTFGNKYLTKILKELKGEMPEGFSAEAANFSFNWNNVKRQYGLLFVLIIAIYIICAILYENLKQPIYIVLVIPISFIGTFLIFSLFDLYFDQGGYAAFILLGGLTVNAAIFIINDLNNYNQKTPKKYNNNVIKAVWSKSFPIMLTILSTIAGLIPFVINGQSEVFWFSLAIGTIGGLIFSLLAIFIFLPVMLFETQHVSPHPSHFPEDTPSGDFHHLI